MYKNDDICKVMIRMKKKSEKVDNNNYIWVEYERYECKVRCI